VLPLQGGMLRPTEHVPDKEVRLLRTVALQPLPGSVDDQMLQLRRFALARRVSYHPTQIWSTSCSSSGCRCRHEVGARTTTLEGDFPWVATGNASRCGQHFSTPSKELMHASWLCS
jgi:hypothetical protein